MNTFQATIRSIREICQDTVEVEFDLAPNQIDFVAGQYVWVQIPSYTGDPRGNTRAFSIVSTPIEKQHLRILFRKSTGGFKQKLLSLASTERVIIQGPFGSLKLPDKAGTSAVLITGGVGIAPAMSMICDASGKASPQQLRLLTVNSTPERVPYANQFPSLKARNVHFDYVHIYGHIQWKDIAAMSEDLTNPMYYIIGTEEMVHDVAQELFNQGIPYDHMRFDQFTFRNNSPYETDRLTPLKDRVFRLAIEDAFNHMIITDLEGKVVFANAAAGTTTGYSPSEMIGNTPRLWGGLMDSKYYEKLWDTIKVKRTVFAGEIINRRKDGTRYTARIKISPITEPSDTLIGFIGTEEDVTKEKQIDKEKSEFVSLASHQLRTPLTSINWYIEMLQTGDAGPLSDKQSEYLSEVYKGSKRMVQLVNELLNVSRMETGRLAIEPVSTDLIFFIQEVVKELEPIAHKAHCLLTFVSHVQISVQVPIDQVLLRQVLINVCINAIRYSSAERKGLVEIVLNSSDSSYVMSIQDNGIGISKTDQSRIFEKLFRTEGARNIEADGNGLGLYLAKQIMESSGGSIRFTSELGKGTKFYVTIPKEGMRPKIGEKGLVNE